MSVTMVAVSTGRQGGSVITLPCVEKPGAKQLLYIYCFYTVRCNRNVSVIWKNKECFDINIVQSDDNVKCTDNSACLAFVTRVAPSALILEEREQLMPIKR